VLECVFTIAYKYSLYYNAFLIHLPVDQTQWPSELGTYNVCITKKKD